MQYTSAAGKRAAVEAEELEFLVVLGTLLGGDLEVCED